MKEEVGDFLRVKAAGGIRCSVTLKLSILNGRDFALAVKMIEAGASRLGCSAGVAIVTTTEMSGGDY